MMPLLALIIALSLAAQAAEPARTVTVTAYCACKICCGKDAKGITAAGTRPMQGRTVAASRSIPMGTRIHIEGIGWRTVEDRLAKRFDGRVDVYFASHDAAKKFGKQQLKIERLK